MMARSGITSASPESIMGLSARNISNVNKGYTALFSILYAYPRNSTIKQFKWILSVFYKATHTIQEW